MTPRGHEELPGELRDAIARLDAPRAPRGLIGRVVSERARGVRAAIPGGEPAVTRRPVRRSVLAAAVVVLAVGTVVLQRWSPTVDIEENPVALGACGMTMDIYRALARSAFLLSVACAQETTGPVVAPPPPAVLDARALQEGAWTYDLIGNEGKLHSSSLLSISTVGSGVDRVWQAVASAIDAENRRGTTDTLYLAADGVTPVRRIMRKTLDGRAIRHTTMTYGPGIVEVRQDYPGHASRRTTWRVEFPKDLRPLMTPLHGPGWGFASIVRLLPLHDAWNGAVYVPGFPTSGYATEALRVVGEDSVRVPAGLFDCWRVTVQSRGQHWLTLWVSKDSPVLVKAVLGPEGARVQESVLVSFEPSRR